MPELPSGDRAFQKVVVSGSFVELYWGSQFVPADSRGNRLSRSGYVELRDRIAVSLPPRVAVSDEGALVSLPVPTPWLDDRIERIDHLKSIGLNIARSRALIDPSVRARSVARSKTAIARLVRHNADRYVDRNGVVIPLKFLTLTFKNPIYSDLVIANKQFTRYFRSLDREFKKELGGRGLHYVGVHELQQRGVIHYHVLLFNFPFADKVYSRLRKKWLQDSPQLKLEVVRGRDPTLYATNYVMKYITKGMNDPRFFGKKRYLSSKFLAKPAISRDPVIVDLIKKNLQPCLVECRDFVEQYFSGSANFYIIPRRRSLYAYLLDSEGDGILDSDRQQLLFDESLKRESDLRPLQRHADGLIP